MNSLDLDLLALLIVSKSQSAELMKDLNQDSFTFTVMDSSSGLINEPMVCLLVGFHQERTESLLTLVRKDCHPYQRYIPTQGLLPGELTNLPMIEARLGGAMVYMMNIERTEQF